MHIFTIANLKITQHVNELHVIWLSHRIGNVNKICGNIAHSSIKCERMKNNRLLSVNVFLYSISPYNQRFGRGLKIYKLLLNTAIAH